MAEVAAGPAERTTSLAVQEKAKLFKSLRRLDMLLFLVCAIVGLDTLGQVSSYGAQTFTWVIVLAVLFLFPYVEHPGFGAHLVVCEQPGRVCRCCGEVTRPYPARARAWLDMGRRAVAFPGGGPDLDPLRPLGLLAGLRE